MVVPAAGAAGSSAAAEGGVHGCLKRMLLGPEVDFRRTEHETKLVLWVFDYRRSQLGFSLPLFTVRFLLKLSSKTSKGTCLQSPPAGFTGQS